MWKISTSLYFAGVRAAKIGIMPYIELEVPTGKGTEQKRRD